MENSIVDRAIRPTDCTMLVCIPTDEEEFLRQVAAPENYEFARRVSTNYAVYRRVVSKFFEQATADITQLGVKVVPRATLTDLSDALRDGQRPVVCLFAHWSETGVEFADGHKSIDRVVASVPHCFSGVLDLCVCHPTALVRRLKGERPTIAGIKFVDAPATVSLWIGLYHALARRLSELDLTYNQALESVILEALNG